MKINNRFFKKNKKIYLSDIFKKLGKKFINNGATILGGCCETNPMHIAALSELK